MEAGASTKKQEDRKGGEKHAWRDPSFISLIYNKIPIWESKV